MDMTRVETNKTTRQDVLLARQRCSIPGTDEPLQQVRQGKASLYVALPSPTGSLHSLANQHPLHLLDAIDRFKNETLRVYGVLEIQLSGKYTGEPRDYLAGNGKGKYSVADIKTWPWVKGYEFSGFTKDDMQPFPHLLKWIDRIAERKAVQTGIGKKYQQE